LLTPCRFPRSLDSHQTLKAWIDALWCIEQRGELPKPILVQAEKDLIQHNSFRALTRSFQHEIGAILAQQIGRMVDQVTVLGNARKLMEASRMVFSFICMHNSHT
jgi:hypothetical protein